MDTSIRFDQMIAMSVKTSALGKGGKGRGEPLGGRMLADGVLFFEHFWFLLALLLSVAG